MVVMLSSETGVEKRERDVSVVQLAFHLHTTATSFDNQPRFAHPHQLILMDQITLASREYEFNDLSIEALEIDEDPSGRL